MKNLLVGLLFLALTPHDFAEYDFKFQAWSFGELMYSYETINAELQYDYKISHTIHKKRLQF